jgi:hypothetical protein
MHPLQVAAFVPMAVAARMRRVERRTVAHLRAAGALHAPGATQLQTQGAVGRFVIGRLERSSVLHAVGNGRYYLSEAAYRRFRAARRRRALAIVSVLLLSGAWLFFKGTF